MPQPNVLLITATNCARTPWACYNNPVIRTPAHRCLAARGVRFERVYTAIRCALRTASPWPLDRYPSVPRRATNGTLDAPHGIDADGGAAATWLCHLCRGQDPLWSAVRFPPMAGPCPSRSRSWPSNPQPEAWELPWYGLERYASPRTTA